MADFQSEAAEEVKRAIASALGSGALREDEATRARADAWVELDDVPMLIELVRLARARSFWIAPVGGATALGSFSLGKPTVVASLRKLRAVREYEPHEPFISVDAGVTVEEVAARAAPDRLWCAWDPPGAGATVGAVTALAAAGPLRHRFGPPRDQVLGLEVVDGSGRELHLGGRVIKNVAGYDLTRLFVGSAGTLGVITRVHLRLRPLPEADETRASSFASLDSALARLPSWARLPEVCAVELLSPKVATALGLAAKSCALVRLMGASEAVRAAADAVGGAPVDGTVWTRLSAQEAGWGNVLRLGHRSTELLASVALLPADAPWAAHWADGIVRTPSHGVDLRRVGSVMAARGGSARVFPRRPAAEPAASSAVQALEAGLRRAFDPQGVFAEARV